MQTQLKLFVWEGVLTDYTDGIAFALAHDAEEARQLIIANNSVVYVKENDLAADPQVFDTSVGFALSGGG